jgi:Tol biopolymer transport system component
MLKKDGGKDREGDFFMKKNKILNVVLIDILMVFMLIMGGCAFLDELINRPVPIEDIIKNDAVDAIDISNFTNRSMLQGVTQITFDELEKTNPVVSPDGTKLLYCETKASLNQGTSQTTIQSDIIMLRNINSSAKTPLVTTGNAFTPGWYEDSTRFLYSFSENNTSRIVRSSSSGGGRTNITRNPVGVNDNRPVVKNGEILFNTWESGKWYIYSVLENGSAITRLSEGWDPSWHPNERKYLFVRGSPSGIWEMDMTTMQETMLYEMPRFNIRRPIYTYDGKYIVFQRGSEQMVSGTQFTTTSTPEGRTTRTSGTEIRWQLYSINADGSNESVLTEGNVDCTHPTLDQSNNLFFISNASGVRSNKTEIYKARLRFD